MQEIYDHNEGLTLPTTLLHQFRQRYCQMIMTVADVGKVLMSVAKACESGYRVVFDEEGSYMEEKKSGTRTKLHEKNGVYVIHLRAEGKREAKRMLGKGAKMYCAMSTVINFISTRQPTTHRCDN